MCGGCRSKVFQAWSAWIPQKSNMDTPKWFGNGDSGFIFNGPFLVSILNFWDVPFWERFHILSQRYFWVDDSPNFPFGAICFARSLEVFIPSMFQEIGGDTPKRKIKKTQPSHFSGAGNILAFLFPYNCCIWTQAYNLGGFPPTPVTGPLTFTKAWLLWWKCGVLDLTEKTCGRIQWEGWKGEPCMTKLVGRVEGLFIKALTFGHARLS